jgi:hypothetical protein
VNGIKPTVTTQKGSVEVCALSVNELSPRPVIWSATRMPIRSWRRRNTAQT